MSQTTPDVRPAPPVTADATKTKAPKAPRGRLSRAERAMIGGSVVLVAVIGGGTWWADRLNDTPEIVIPKAVMPSPNAFDEYVAATAKIVRKSDVDDASEQMAGRWKPRTPPPPPGGGPPGGGSPVSRGGATGRMIAASATKPFTKAERAVLVRDNAPALSGVRAAFKREYRHPRVTDINYLMPYLAEYRRMTRLFEIEAQTRADKRDFAGAASSGIDAMQLGVETPRGGALICALVGYACEGIGRRTAQRYVERLTAEECRAAIQRLEAINTARTPLADTLREEKWFGLGALKTAFADKTVAQVYMEFGGMSGSAYSASGSGGPFDFGVMLEKLRLQGRMAGITKRTVIENFQKYTDQQIARAERNPWTRGAKPVPVPSDPISQMLLPTLDGVGFSDARTRTQTNLLLARLAVRAYHLKKKTLPPSLDALVQQGYLQRVPGDPFAPAPRTPLRYRRTPGKTGVAASQGFLLYSVGPDGVDDGGKPIPVAAKYLVSQGFDQDGQGDVVAAPAGRRLP